MARKLVGFPSTHRKQPAVRVHPLLFLVDLIPTSPISWSNSSTIFISHPSQPILIGLASPLGKQFIVPSPDPVLHSPLLFEPPSAISISPSDQWLFAFYPGRERGGVACIWECGHRVDTWLVKECWSINRGAGIVTTAWAGTEREVRDLFAVQSLLITTLTVGSFQ